MMDKTRKFRDEFQFETLRFYAKKPPESDERYWRKKPDGPRPTLFQHSWYIDYGQFPNGAADMAGYWVEAQITDGVVLFDRRDLAESPEADSNAVYLHPDRYEAPYRIVKLLPEQRQALLDSLVAEDEPTAPLLPIIVGKDNQSRRNTHCILAE
ncbi:hypothetical protein PG994_002574 [Apiospora phragmitis]|uniref:Uncharacterized protein n=1 Tax=Apiospora phragmitis TaxID=2905665 RepID=A0ABR1W5J1_9PEZI